MADRSDTLKCMEISVIDHSHLLASSLAAAAWIVIWVESS